jgi:hypothetical protein
MKYIQAYKKRIAFIAFYITINFVIYQWLFEDRETSIQQDWDTKGYVILVHKETRYNGVE